MNPFNMIIVIGIAIILSLSTIQVAPTPKYPKILPDNAPFVNHTESKMCNDSTTFCGWAYSKNDRIGLVRLTCVCPSGKQCEHAETSTTDTRVFHYYKCTLKT